MQGNADGEVMLRILLYTSWRATLLGGGVGAALGALFGAGLLLGASLLTGPQSQWLSNTAGGLTYGLYVGLVAGVALGVLNGVALGCVLSIGANRPYSERPDLNRYTAMSLVFNAVIAVAVVTRLPNSVLLLNAFSIAATGILVLLATAGAAWVDARIARSYLRSAHHKLTTT